MTAGLHLPDYGAGTITSVLPAVGAHLGLPGLADDPLGLPDAGRYVVWLVDGMGWEVLQPWLGDLPALAELMAGAAELSAPVPSTTTAAIPSFGTGLPPGQHGLVGYRFFDPDLGGYVTPLSWDRRIDPITYQPRATVLDRAESAGVTVTRVVPLDHVNSGFSLAALRGPATGFPEDNLEAWLNATVTAARGRGRALVYTYDRRLDHTGHGHGLASPAWHAAAVELDRRVGLLRAALPAGTVLVITADHGMIDVPAGRRLHIEQTPELAAGLEHVGGEARLRHLYTRSPEAVAARWRAYLGERAWVRLRDEAVAANWFGPVTPEAARRLGDVIVALRDDWALLSRRLPIEAKLVGMHGSLTRPEMAVPLIAVQT
jgi:hypothetical protein